MASIGAQRSSANRIRSRFSRGGLGIQVNDSASQSKTRKGPTVVGALIGLLIVVAIVLVLLKVAVAGGILGLIAIVLLILLLLGRL
jgi:hypothetical protein